MGYIPRVLDARLRANPAYRLVAFERLDEGQRRALEHATEVPGQYGVLLPVAPPGLGLKTVCCDTALLFTSLLEAGPLPHYLRGRARAEPEELDRELAELILDGILEIEVDGELVHGPRARARVLSERSGPAPRGVLAELSHAALRYAQSLPIDDPAQICGRLYRYNSVPRGPSLCRRLGSSTARDAALGLAAGERVAQLLAREFRAIDRDVEDRGWRIWRTRSRGPDGGRRARRSRGELEGVYKLYVSPLPDALLDCFPRIVEGFVEAGVPRFKLGRGLDGLLRPDKLVAYFDDFGSMRVAASVISKHLATGVAAQGVPFSASIHGDALLSWGIDPPRAAVVGGWQGGESWRLWIVRHLARALVAAKQQPGLGVTPWHHALERLRLAGVDTDSWVPSTRVWSRAGAST